MSLKLVFLHHPTSKSGHQRSSRGSNFFFECLHFFIDTWCNPQSLVCYLPAVITSNSVREFTIVSAQSGAEKFTYQLRQNITYRDCRHATYVGAETLQLNVERIFAIYVKEERVLRYAITNKIGRGRGKLC